jgi:hypothetical protein
VQWQQGRLDEIADPVVKGACNNPSMAVLRSAIPTALYEAGRIDDAR